MPNVCEIFRHAAAKTVLAPMAGYTDFAFRKVCHDYGVGLTVTEMISAKALVMNNAATFTMLHRDETDKPCFCQIFGHEPQVMADSVRFAEVAAYEGVDINMGCPVKKIVSNGDGSALMENFDLAAKCITAVRLALPADKPLSVKFRLGITDDTLAVDFAKMCRDSGTDFVTVHFRTRKQMYAGNADFRLLDDLVATGVPVVANGDVRCKADYDKLVDRGAFAVAVGRGALGHPQLFADIAELPYAFDVEKVIVEQTAMLSQLYPDRVVANEMKKHISFYLKGMRGAKSTIVAVNACKCTVEMLNLVHNYFAGADLDTNAALQNTSANLHKSATDDKTK